MPSRPRNPPHTFAAGCCCCCNCGSAAAAAAAAAPAAADAPAAPPAARAAAAASCSRRCSARHSSFSFQTCMGTDIEVHRLAQRRLRAAPTEGWPCCRAMPAAQAPSTARLVHIPCLPQVGAACSRPAAHLPPFKELLLPNGHRRLQFVDGPVAGLEEGDTGQHSSRSARGRGWNEQAPPRGRRNSAQREPCERPPRPLAAAAV